MICLLSRTTASSYQPMSSSDYGFMGSWVPHCLSTERRSFFSSTLLQYILRSEATWWAGSHLAHPLQGKSTNPGHLIRQVHPFPLKCKWGNLGTNGYSINAWPGLSSLPVKLEIMFKAVSSFQHFNLAALPVWLWLVFCSWKPACNSILENCSLDSASCVGDRSASVTNSR